MLHINTLPVAIITMLSLNAAVKSAAIWSPPTDYNISCLVNPANDPSGFSPPGTCAHSTIQITSDICNSCSCDGKGGIVCAGLDDSCTADALADVCTGYWGCACLGPDGPAGGPCANLCGPGLGHGW